MDGPIRKWQQKDDRNSGLITCFTCSLKTGQKENSPDRNSFKMLWQFEEAEPCKQTAASDKNLAKSIVQLTDALLMLLFCSALLFSFHIGILQDKQLVVLRNLANWEGLNPRSNKQTIASDKNLITMHHCAMDWCRLLTLLCASLFVSPWHFPRRTIGGASTSGQLGGAALGNAIMCRRSPAQHAANVSAVDRSSSYAIYSILE